MQSPHSNVTIWPDSNNTLTISSNVKAVHHPGPNTYSQNNAHIITEITENI